MSDSYIIGTYWGPRAEQLPQVKDKILETLQKLREVDEHFTNWFELGWSRKKALEKKFRGLTSKV